MQTGVVIHEQRQDERSDRAVTRVLWLSLAVAVVPMVAVVALAGPTMLGLGRPDGGLQSELTSGRMGAGEQLRGILARGASGIVRAVKGEPEAVETDFSALNVRPFDPTAARVPARRGAGTEICAQDAQDAAGAIACEEALGSLRRDAEMRLRLIELPEPEPASPVSFVLERGTGEDSGEAGWRLEEEGLFVRQVGDATFAVQGAVSADDFASLRPISAVGVGSYASDDTALKHSTLTGTAAHTVSQGRWRFRQEIDFGANYLALGKVRLDAGEAGLFLPETDEWVFSARPSLALEGELDPVPGIKILPSIRAGATWLSQTEFQNAALMLDAPTSVAGLSAFTPLDRTFADVEAGIGVAAAERIQLSVRYGRVFGDTLDADTGRVELNMQF